MSFHREKVPIRWTKGNPLRMAARDAPGPHVAGVQPNRPVMYSSVCFFSGDVNIFFVSPNSISSPR
jgi:hypothetical protein